MPTIADLRAKVSVDGADKAKKDLADLKGSGGTSGGGILGLADSFKVGLGAVTGFITGFEGFKLAGDALGFVKDQFADILAQGSSQQAVMAQTAAVIKSTGGAAHISADQVGDLADKLAQLTGTSDDTIQSAENILLTFTNINKNIFPQTTGLVLDLATAMHEDLNSAALQIGKALNDPIQGVTALRRVGVQLTDQQAKMVEQFVKTGQTGKAQALIIKELTKEVGGSAEAYGKTFPGMVDRFNVKLDQAKEKIGLAVIPILETLLNTYVMPLADWIGAHLPAAIDILTKFLDTKLVPGIKAVMDSPFVKTVEGWATAILDKFVPAVDDKKGMAAHTNKAKNAVASLDKQTGTTTKNMAGPYVQRINTMLGKIDEMTDHLGGDSPKGKGLNPAIIRVNDNLDKMDTKLNANAKAVQQNEQQIPGWQQALIGVAGTWDGLKDHVHAAADALGEFKDAVVERFGAAQPAMFGILLGMSSHLNEWKGHFKHTWDGLWDALSAPVQIAFHTIEGIVTIGLDTLDALSTGKWDKVRQDWEKALKKILQDVLQFVNGVRKAFGSLPPALQGASASDIFQGVGGALLNRRASGGPVSGPFIGAEGRGSMRGMELLVSPGLYNAPPGSYVFNAMQTAAMAGTSSGSGGMRGATYVTNVYPQQATIDTRQLARIQQRQDLLNRMRG